MSQFIDSLRDKLAEEDLAEGSRQRILIDCRQLEEWYFGTYASEINPADLALTNIDLAEYRTWLLKKCQANTVQRKFASIRGMLKLLAPALLTSLRMPKVPQTNKPAPSGFTKNERLSIFRAASKLSTRDKAIIYLAMWTGARASSLCNVKLSKICLNNRSGSIEFDIAKGGKPYSVPLNIEAREALTEWIAERPPVKHDFLFTSDRYPFEPISRWTIHNCWHRQLAKNLPEELAKKLKGPHQARHGLARQLIDQGTPLPDVAAILNHSSVATTANIYMRPSERDLQNALERAVGEEIEE
ncbi:MAG: tyrosine-type recombinase/integrase [bacterium]